MKPTDNNINRKKIDNIDDGHTDFDDDDDDDNCGV